MEWVSWLHLGATCMIRVQDGQGWWSKVERTLGHTLIVVQHVGVPYATEDEARAACEVAAGVLNQLV